MISLRRRGGDFSIKHRLLTGGVSLPVDRKTVRAHRSSRLLTFTVNGAINEAINEAMGIGLWQ